jgi:hypothetical protein
MVKKTIKQLEEELKTQEEAAKVAQQSYGALLEQAQQLQKEHGRRLMYLRLFERFANDMDRSLAQLKSDINEINVTLETEEGTTEQTGEEL